MADWPTAAQDVSKAIADGRFITEGTETKVKSSFEEVPKVWKRLFSVSSTFRLLPPASANPRCPLVCRATTRASLSLRLCR